MKLLSVTALNYVESTNNRNNRLRWGFGFVEVINIFFFFFHDSIIVLNSIGNLNRINFKNIIFRQCRTSQHESRSSPVLYPSNPANPDIQLQPPKQQIFSVPQHTQQRVHVIKKNIYSMSPNNSCPSPVTDNATVIFHYAFINL